MCTASTASVRSYKSFLRTVLLTNFSLGKRGSQGASIWSEINSVVPSTDFDARELEDAFVEGMALLRDYPLRQIGGIENVMQLAYDLADRRRHEQQNATPANAGIGERLKNSVWRSFASQNTIPESHEEEEEDTSEEEESEESSPDDQHLQPPSANNGRSTLSTRLAQTVWKGITNQSAMEVLSPPPSPSPSPRAISPMPSPLTSPPVNASDLASGSVSAPAGNRASTIWGYAEKLRDSDAAATFAKVSTNWRVKAIDAWNKRAVPTTGPSNSNGNGPVPNSAPAHYTSMPVRQSLSPNDVAVRRSLGPSPTPRTFEDSRRSSLPGLDRSEEYSPPPMPAFFRPVRDSWMPPMKSPGSPTASDVSADEDGHGRRNTSLASMVGLDRHSRTPSTSPQSGGRSGPRPLLLNSSNLITATHTPPTSAQSERAWADNVRSKRPGPTHRHSQSSMSSAPSESLSVPRRTETFGQDLVSSRVVPINRRTPSPMANKSRRHESTSSTLSDPPTHRRHPTEGHTRSQSGWARADGHDSPSSPPPQTPLSIVTNDLPIRVKETETQRGSLVIPESDFIAESPHEEATPTKPRRKNPSLSHVAITNDDSTDSSIAQMPTRTSRVKSKRLPPRLATLRTKETSRPPAMPERSPSPNTLAVEWPEEGDSVTPKAAAFDASVHTSTSPVSPRRRTRKVSGEKGTRSRKVSTESKESKHKRESAAVEGDDEGYDDLLTAYSESEDSTAQA